MRLVCLPIDSRPCNTQFVRRITEWAGSELVLPEASLLDDFTRPAPFDASLAFLERELPRADAAVVSLDHLCYGGLLASREETVPEEEALRRVSRLRELLEKHSGVPVYLNTILLRSSISTLRRADLAVYQAVTEYSVHYDRYARFGLPEDLARMNAARERIPAPLLEKVFRIRRRNLAVTLAGAELAADGLLAGLSILQEDCQEYGLPCQDQRAAEARLRELGLRERYPIRNGTDEGGALQAAQALRAGRPPLEAEIRWTGGTRFIAPYEDRPFEDNVRLACQAIGIRSVPESQTVICVCCPEHGEQGEASDPVSSSWLAQCAAAADRAVSEGRRVYLLDVLRANGGIPGLLQAMKQADGLWGYSAWNTASNSLGTLLAQIISDSLAGAPNRAFFQERLLDDLAYQGHIRTLLNEELTARGEDVFALTDKPGAEETLRLLYRRELPGLWPLKTLPEYQVSLPWSRTFEVFAQVRQKGTSL